MRNMMEQALASTLIARRTSQYHKNQFAWFKSGENYDCTIQVGCTDSTKQLFKCHRHVLAVASPAFNQMLHGQFQESKMGIDEPLSFPDVTPDAFKAAMNYVYGDDTTCLEKSLSLATSVFEFASKWQILDLGMVAAEICLNFELSANDLISLYEIFSLHNHPIEAERTMKMMCDRGSEVLKNLRDASKDTVKAILKQQSINIFSEKELLDAIAEWGASQIATSDASGKALSQDSSDEELLDAVEDSDFKGNALRTRALVCQLLKMVRFKAFSPRDFGFLFISGACPILTDKEKQNIFSRLQTGTGAVLASVKGFDLQSAWRGKFECEPKVLCLQGKLGSKEFSRMIWISPDVSDVYLLSVGLHSVCHLTSGAAVDALIELTLKGKGLSKVRFSGWCCKAETEDHWKGNMIRLTNPFLLQAGLTYELRVSGPKEPLHEFKLTETHYVVDFGAHLTMRTRVSVSDRAIHLPLTDFDDAGFHYLRQALQEGVSKKLNNRKLSLTAPAAKMGETKASTLATLKTGHTAALNEKLLTWFKSGDHSDCTIEVGTVDSKLFKCHRLTLAAASPVFERMLFGNFEESKKGIDDPIALPDVTPTTFQAAMNFVYGCDTSLLQESFELTLHVFEFASKWEISDLDKVAAEFCFGMELSAEDLLILHNLFLTFSFQAEAKRIMNLICDRGSEVLKYLQIASKETVHAILCQESINIFSEKDLLDGVQTWGSAQVEASADGRRDFKEVRAVITELLELIRFKAFTICDFGHLAMKGECPVLKNHEKLNLLALVQVQKGDTYPSISKFDVASNWRGKFKQDTRKVTCLNGLNATHALGNTAAITVKATSDVYLLSVGLNSLKYLERYPQSVHFSIVVYHNEKVLSKVKHEIVCEHDQKDLMFSLANPLLLKSGLVHKIVVNHILNVDKYQRRYKVDNDFIVTNATAVHDGVRMRCVGVGDVCALECASP